MKRWSLEKKTGVMFPNSPGAWVKYAEAAARIDALEADVARMRTALDAIYNHNEAARQAVIQHYGLWHSESASMLGLEPRT